MYYLANILHKNTGVFFKFPLWYSNSQLEEGDDWRWKLLVIKKINFSDKPNLNNDHEDDENEQVETVTKSSTIKTNGGGSKCEYLRNYLKYIYPKKRNFS